MSTTDHDAPLKISGLSLLWALGYVVRAELLFSEPRAKSVPRNRPYLELTDVDVLGYLFGPLMQTETTVIDCGSGQSRSPIQRVFWTRGIMEALDINRAICVVGRETEEEHRFAAQKLNITLVSAKQFTELCNSLLGKSTVKDFEQYFIANTQWLAYVANTRSAFGDYLLFEYFNREWERVPVTLPAQIRRWSVNLVPNKSEHAFGFFELAILLSIGLMKIVTSLTLIRPDHLPTAVYTLVLGGGNRVKFVEALIKKLDAANALQPELPQGEDTAEEFIPYFNELLDLISRLAAKSGAARFVPRYIQAFHLARLAGDATKYPEFLGHDPDPVTTKLALDVLNYLRIAADCSSSIAELYAEV